MSKEQPLFPEFLTREESAEVDKALLTSRDKFAARLAIYALRSLKEIANKSGLSVSQIGEEQIISWIAHDEAMKNQLHSDASFAAFFSRLVIASLHPLNRVSQENQVSIEELTVLQIIRWFESDRQLGNSEKIP